VSTVHVAVVAVREDDSDPDVLVASSYADITADVAHFLRDVMLPDAADFTAHIGEGAPGDDLDELLTRLYEQDQYEEFCRVLNERTEWRISFSEHSLALTEEDDA
jgi:hypothetical protein